MIVSEKKNKVLKRAKKWTFSKGVSPWILSKNRIFSYRSFFTEIMSEKIVFGYFKQKAIIMRPKNWSFNRGQIMDIFWKGSTWIRKRRFWYCKKKRKILSGKNWSFEKGQKMDILHGFCQKIELSLIAVFHRNYVRKDRFWIF